MDQNRNVDDQCEDGCEKRSCCISWNFYQIPTMLPYFKNMHINQGFVMKTCSNEKSSALIARFPVEGKDYAEVDMVGSTNFYMTWRDFAADYRKEYCEISGIDPDTCVDNTEEDMVNQVWGGHENAFETKYRVGPIC